MHLHKLNGFCSRLATTLERGKKRCMTWPHTSGVHQVSWHLLRYEGRKQEVIEVELHPFPAIAT